MFKNLLASIFRKDPDRPGLSGAKIITVIVVFAVILTVINSFEVIPTGYSGVKITFGQVSDVTLSPGFHFIVPYAQTVKLVNNKQQDKLFSTQIWGETAEMTTVYAQDVVITYRISSDKSAYIYANISADTDDLISYDLVASALKAAMKELEVKDVTNRGKIEPLACEKLAAQVETNYGPGVITVIKVTINQMDFEESYNQAIAEKQIAQQIYEKQQIENQTFIERAQAEADALLIKSKAEAEANEILNKSLNGYILEYMKIEKWDGHLPQATGTQPFIMIE